MSKKKLAFRVIRKTAYITRGVTSKAANFSGRVENKASRIINGTDPTIQIHNKVLQEKVVAEALPELIPIHPALPLPNRGAAVNLFIPSLQNSSFFGGTATALILAAKLALKKNMPLRVVETLKHGNAKTHQLQEFLQDAGFTINVENISLLSLAGRKYNHYGYIDLHPEDLFIASAWWDAHLLNMLPLGKKFIYMIQDFEPIFYNNSDQYLLAEETYQNKSFIPVFNTKLMYDFMLDRGYALISQGNLFYEPAVNIGKRIGYAQQKTNGQKRRLFIYGRPSVHRNLFYRALSVVDEVFASGALSAEDWEIFMAGQDKLPDILLDSGVTVSNLGKLSLDEYYSFAKTIDVGISLMMAPHPSYPPLELASLGASVVTTSYKNKQTLSSYSKNIIVTDGTVTELVKGVTLAAKMTYDTRLANAKSTTTSDDWNATLQETINKISKLV